MEWEIEGTDEFAAWFDALTQAEKRDAIASIDRLRRAAILLLGGDKGRRSMVRNARAAGG